MFYWNKDAWAKIGKTEAPKTWGEDSPWMKLFYNARAWVG